MYNKSTKSQANFRFPPVNLANLPPFRMNEWSATLRRVIFLMSIHGIRVSAPERKFLHTITWIVHSHWPEFLKLALKIVQQARFFLLLGKFVSVERSVKFAIVNFTSLMNFLGTNTRNFLESLEFWMTNRTFPRVFVCTLTQPWIERSLKISYSCFYSGN